MHFLRTVPPGDTGCAPLLPTCAARTYGSASSRSRSADAFGAGRPSPSRAGGDPVVRTRPCRI